MGTVTFDFEAAGRKVVRAARAATRAMAAQALEDSNYFARRLSGELVRSSYAASELDKGFLAWDTPYAKRIYYTGEPRKEINPNAERMWAHRARAVYGERWLETGRRILREEMK